MGWHQYTPVTDWIKPDWAYLRPIIVKAADAYAAEKGITPRDCAKEMADQKAEK